MKPRHLNPSMEPRDPPVWFGPALARAQHQDQMDSWPWLLQLLHRWLVDCPVCNAIKRDATRPKTR